MLLILFYHTYGKMSRGYAFIQWGVYAIIVTVGGCIFKSEVIILSSAQILWDNWNKYDDLDGVYRQGFLKARVHGYGNEAKELIEKYHTETTLVHSGRAAMLFSDMMDLYPSWYQGIDKYIALKVILNHDIGELVVGDVCDDGRKEHDEKKDPEWLAVIDHYSVFPEEVYLPCKYTHREFDEAKTFLGQSIKLADKLDFLAKLIKLEGQGCDLKHGVKLSARDLELAKEIKTLNFADIVANHFRHMLVEQDFDSKLAQLSIQFITCGLRCFDRPFFEWWRPDGFGYYQPHQL